MAVDEPGKTGDRLRHELCAIKGGCASQIGPSRSTALIDLMKITEEVFNSLNVDQKGDVAAEMFHLIACPERD
ncbi:hypothetical protein [Bosea massiliensis]|uniref:Uncharacterized protein n=1 Tax=Bosea massiliensis TaxID=151419 RepID=A0ABW0P303_9HYPH